MVVKILGSKFWRVVGIEIARPIYKVWGKNSRVHV